MDPRRPEKNKFVELKSTCSGKTPLRGYKLIVMNAQTKSGSIDLVATLWNERTDENGYFTIGGTEVSTANIKIPHNMVKFKSGFTGRSSVISNFLPNKEIRAIGLLYDSNNLNTFKDIVLSKKQPLVEINGDILKQLKEYLIDMVVYTRDKTCDKSELIEIIHEGFVTKKYAFREFNGKKDANKIGISLNRCAAETTGFLPEKF